MSANANADADADANANAGSLRKAFAAGAPRVETYGHYVSPLSTQELEVYVRQCLVKVCADLGEMPSAAAAADAVSSSDTIAVTLDSYCSARLLRVARSIISASFAGANCNVSTSAVARTTLELKLVQDIEAMSANVSKTHLAKSLAAQVA